MDTIKLPYKIKVSSFNLNSTQLGYRIVNPKTLHYWKHDGNDWERDNVQASKIRIYGVHPHTRSPGSYTSKFNKYYSYFRIVVTLIKVVML